MFKLSLTGFYSSKSLASDKQKSFAVLQPLLPCITHPPKRCHNTALHPPEYHGGQQVGWPWEESLKSLSCFSGCSTWQGTAYCTLHWELLARPLASQRPDRQPITLSSPHGQTAPCHCCPLRKLPFDPGHTAQYSCVCAEAQKGGSVCKRESMGRACLFVFTHTSITK